MYNCCEFLKQENKKYKDKKKKLNRISPAPFGVKWYDEEFQRIIEEKLNSGKPFKSLNDVALITLEQWNTVSFKDNKNVKTVKDLEKFPLLNTIPDYQFSGCSSLEGTLELPSNIEYIGAWAFYATGYSSLILNAESNNHNGDWGTLTFSKMKNLEGIIDLRNFKIGAYYEFNNSGTKPFLVLLTLDKQSTNFGTWFAGSKISAMAESEEELENGVIKIPEGFTAGGVMAFNNCPNIHTIICPSSMKSIHSLSGGDESWNNIRSFTIGSKCEELVGSVCTANGYNGKNTKVYCYATTPPEMKLGGIGLGGNNELQYPFMSTKVSEVHVPEGCMDAYLDDSKIVAKACKPYTYNGELEENVEIGWSRFAGNIIDDL